MYLLYSAKAWRNGGQPISEHQTEAEAWGRAIELVEASPIKPVFSLWCHAHADYRVVQPVSDLKGRL